MQGVKFVVSGLGSVWGLNPCQGVKFVVRGLRWVWGVNPCKRSEMVMGIKPT